MYDFGYFEEPGESVNRCYFIQNTGEFAPLKLAHYLGNTEAGEYNIIDIFHSDGTTQGSQDIRSQGEVKEPLFDEPHIVLPHTSKLICVMTRNPTFSPNLM